MKVVEIKVIYESDNIDEATKEISNVFYDFGVTGLKIEAVSYTHLTLPTIA